MKLTYEQHDALCFFIIANQRNWKQRLRVLWETDKPHKDRALLQQIRNQWGPEWLARVKTSELLKEK